METVLVTGATGLLGSSLVPLMIQRGHTVKAHARSGDVDFQADLSVPDVAHRLLDKIKPGVIVNLVGLTDVDRCEAMPNQAYLANVRTVENIAGWAKLEKMPCHLVHVSTDQVYDGVGPHIEEQVFLTNYYAFSKYAGELAAASMPSTILRVNFIGRSCCAKRMSLTDWLYRSLYNGEAIQVFDDVLFSPLSMATLSEMIGLAIRKKIVGRFNVGSHAGMSKADFAFAFAGELDIPTRLMTRTTTSQVAFLKAHRPKDMRMECTKFENAFGVKLPIFKDEIKRAAGEYVETA